MDSELEERVTDLGNLLAQHHIAQTRNPPGRPSSWVNGVTTVCSCGFETDLVLGHYFHVARVVLTHSSTPTPPVPPVGAPQPVDMDETSPAYARHLLDVAHGREDPA